MSQSLDENLSIVLKPLSGKSVEIIVWTFTSVATAFLVARLSIRVYVFRKISWDDVLVFTAWTQLFSSAIVSQSSVWFIQDEYDLITHGLLPNKEYAQADLRFFRYYLTSLFLFYFCLWGVKYSFLVFFRQLNAKTRPHRFWWWIVFAITTAALVGSIGDIPYVCLTTTRLDQLQGNCVTPAATNSFQRIIYGNMVIDVATDVLILSIPVILLWNVRIPTKQKMILLALFSVTVLVMVFAVTRAMIIRYTRDNSPVSSGWVISWNFIEMSVAVIIACVASFRQFFIGKARPEALPDSSSSKRSMWRLIRRSRTASDRHMGSRSSEDESYKIEASLTSTLSSSERLHLQSGKREAGSIYVQSTIDVASEELPSRPEATAQGYHHRSWIPAEQV